MTTDMIIWFECNNGNKYYINKDFIPIRIKRGETTLDEIKEKAKRYIKPIRIKRLGINVFVLSASVSLQRLIMHKHFAVMSAK